MMPGWIRAYVRIVEAVNYRVGRATMYLLFVIMAILIWSSITKIAGSPALWTLEMAQFTMVAYFLLGAPYTLQLGTNVRMDLLYSRLAPKRQALWDVVTIFALMFYLGYMLAGAIDSAAWSVSLRFEAASVAWLPFDLPKPQLGFLERAGSAWRPYMWPIKLVICLAFVLMLLQALVHLFRDIAILRDKEI